MYIHFIVGARPNFVKISSLIHAIKNYNQEKTVNFKLIHTGQHYDYNMNTIFFKELGIPEPDYFLNCGGGSQTTQISKIMLEYEKVLDADLPQYCVVVGDVNSTVACAVVAKNFKIKVVHVEAGIRSGDITMPEEVNRILTDSITDLFFTTTLKASNLLINTGVEPSRIHFVGNTMIDTLLRFKNDFRNPFENTERKSITEDKFLVLTLHRPSNVDDLQWLKSCLLEILDSTKNVNIFFPVHPRTRKNLELTGIKSDRLILLEPLGYFEFNFLVGNSIGVITDSGGITEEATVLKIPCITLRDSTERPETVTVGTNVLIGSDLTLLRKFLAKILNNNWKKSDIPKYWDGKTGDRIIDILFKDLNENK